MDKVSSWFHFLWENANFADNPEELAEYQTTWLLRVNNRIHETGMYILVHWMPWLYYSFTRPQNKKRKIFIQLFYGIFLGIAFYFLVLADLELLLPAQVLLGVAICLFLAVGHVISSQVRCLSLLAIPTFAGRTGQAMIKALIFAYLIAGPLRNITNNGQDAIRVLTCHTVLTYNMTKSRFTHMFKPFHEAFLQMRADPSELQGALDSLKGVMGPLMNEIEDTKETDGIIQSSDYMDSQLGETKRSEDIELKYKELRNDSAAEKIKKKYERKLQYRCEKMVNSAAMKCRKAVTKYYGMCKLMAIVSAMEFICLALKPGFLCNTFSLFGGEDICDPNEIIGRDFGASYNFLKQSQKTLKDEFQNVKLHYKVIKIPASSVIDVIRTAYDSARKIIKEFISKKSLVQIIFLVVSKLLAFMFLKIIVEYLHNYVNDVEHDNMYVTLYFRKIDSRRSDAGKLTLLPLKQYELRKISDMYSFRLTDSDMNNLRYSLLELITELIIVSTFVAMDFAIYQLLYILRIHGYIEYIQKGHHDLTLDIKGVGLIASLIRSVAHGFKVKDRIKKMYTNEECLPNPYYPSKYYLFRIYGSFLLLFLLAFVSGYIKRLQHAICAIFYPKAEKLRVVYLYNELLRKRIGHLNYRLAMVKYEQEKYGGLPDELGFFMVLRFKNPKWEKVLLWLGYLTFVDCVRRKCIICRDLEPLSGGEVPCKKIGCYFYYDKQCWEHVVEKKCIGCDGYVHSEI